MSEILARIASPEALVVAAYLAGVYCVATAAGIASGVHVANLSLPAPTTRTGKSLMYGVGLSLILLGLIRSLSYPEYKPEVFTRWIYQGGDAKQIVADGEDVYLLKDNGNIHLISLPAAPLVDDGTSTQQILAGGGVLYILKNNGNIWVYQPLLERDSFRITDPATGTTQIESAGETLYVLKANGNIWRSELPPPAKKKPTEPGEPKPIFKPIYDVTQPDHPAARQLSSSGSILYVLKANGNIARYAPTLGQPFQDIYRNGDAEWIKADGKALYFIRRDGSPCKYRQGRSGIDKAVAREDQRGAREETRCSVIKTGIRAKKLDALGGVAYILTNESKIFRYSAATDSVRELVEAGSNNRDIAAYYQDLFVIETTGSVRRYMEGRLRR
jgi:hypothetical protein